LGTECGFSQAVHQRPEGATNFMPLRLDPPAPSWSDTAHRENKAFYHAQTAL